VAAILLAAILLAGVSAVAVSAVTRRGGRPLRQPAPGSPPPSEGPAWFAKRGPARGPEEAE
jgi:hypothetical protein